MTIMPKNKPTIEEIQEKIVTLVHENNISAILVLEPNTRRLESAAHICQSMTSMTILAVVKDLNEILYQREMKKMADSN